MILERRTDPVVTPRQKIPPRAKVERVTRVTVQPDTPAPKAGQPCPPVTVDMTLIREPDGGRRVLASSPDGQVVGGLDVPAEPAAPLPAPRRWAAGLSWSPVTRTAGVWADRDLRVPLLNIQARLGVEAHQDEAQGLDVRLRVGFAF